MDIQSLAALQTLFENIGNSSTVALKDPWDVSSKCGVLIPLLSRHRKLIFLMCWGFVREFSEGQIYLLDPSRVHGAKTGSSGPFITPGHCVVFHTYTHPCSCYDFLQRHLSGPEDGCNALTWTYLRGEWVHNQMHWEEKDLNAQGLPGGKGNCMISTNTWHGAAKVSDLIWNNVGCVGWCCSGKINSRWWEQLRVSNGKRQPFPWQAARKPIEGKTRAQKTFVYLKCI